jgi:hypothetical protein
MNEPTKQLDLADAIRARDEGIANAEAGAPPNWADDALALIKMLASKHPYICSDCLWASGLPEPPESRALGAVMRNGKTRGYIEPTSQFVNTYQASRHHAPVRVWKSKLVPGVFFEEALLLSRRMKSTT